MTEPLYFENLSVGQRFVSGSATITAVDIKRFAEEFDPQPFHVDDEAARSSLFGGLVASGWHTAALNHASQRRRRAAPCRRHRWGGRRDQLAPTDATRRHTACRKRNPRTGTVAVTAGPRNRHRVEPHRQSGRQSRADAESPPHRSPRKAAGH